MSQEPEVLFERRGVAGIITLNRPKALNALTLGMVRLIHPQLTAWAQDDAILCVIIQGTGDRAFCAGGDIRALHDWGKAGDRQQIDLFAEEYRMNTAIKEFPKPFVALMDGINMGGGVGLSVHGSHRVATERLLFAMPETGIGLFPDVGGTYFLPRCPGEIGMYLGLTGSRIKAADAIYAGIADTYVPSDALDALMASLCEGVAPDAAIGAVSQELEPAPLSVLRAEIDQHFALGSVDAVLKSLTSSGSDWCLKMVSIIESKSPLSTRVTFEQIRTGADLEFRACMALEFRLTNRFMAAPNFYEGVRAVVIEKDQAPKWQPATLADVDDGQVKAYFASLGDEELVL